MSTTEPATPVPASPRHRWWLPIGVVLVVVLLAVLPGIWQAYDLDADTQVLLAMIAMASYPVAVLVLLVWWTFFSGFTWRTVLVGLGCVALAFAGLVLVTRRIESDMTRRGGQLLIRLVFIWEPDPEMELAQHRAGLTATEFAEPINATPAADDFPRFRGKDADGRAPGPSLATDWAVTPPTLLWKQPVGPGYAGFAVAGNVALTAEQRGPDEAVVCYDRATGRERWAHAYPGRWKDAMGDGPRGTPTLDGDDVFNFGATGRLVCLDVRTGKERWAVDVPADLGGKNVTWGLTASPLVVDGLVIVNCGLAAGSGGHSVAAYDQATGKRRWAAGSHGAGYSSPQLATLAGVRQVLVFDAGGLAGLDLGTGVELWRYPWQTFSDMNSVQPLVLPGDRVLISSESANGSALLAVSKTDSGWAVEPVWRNKNLAAKFSAPVATEAGIFGLHNGVLVCLDPTTGERRWQVRQGFGHGQLLLRGDQLLVCDAFGTVVLVAADAERYRELGRFTVFTEKTWNTPALAGKQLFLRNEQEMACVRLP